LGKVNKGKFMSINVNHSSGKISTGGKDLALDAEGIGYNVSVSSNRVVDVLDPINPQDAVTKIFLENAVSNITGGVGVTLSDVQNLINSALDTISLLTPQSPPQFATKVLSVTSLSSYRITDFTQTNNTLTSISASPGSVVNNVTRSQNFYTNTLSEAGPGNSGTINVYKNGTITSTKLLDATINNGTYTDTDNLVISNNVDYGSITGNPLGFDYVINAQVSGNVPAGWNDIYVQHDLVGGTNSQTNKVEWYSDQSSPGNPLVTNKSITPSNVNVGQVYSSTIPHYTSQQQFDISFNVSKLSGDFYPATDNFITSAGTSSNSALNTISPISYQVAGLPTPLPRNYLNATSTLIATYVNVKNSTNIASETETLSIRVDNSYATAVETFTIGSKILYMRDDNNITNIIDETQVSVESVGYGNGNARRISTVNNDTPPETTFNDFIGQTSTLNSWDATVAGGILTHDQTDYSVGYLPPGPDLSTGRSASQYVQFALNRTAVSKFAIEYTGKISGCWVRLPGATTDTTSSQNGWLDATVPYEGVGVPGDTTAAGGNGSNGCGLAGVVITGSHQANKTVNITFGTESSSNATDEMIILRIKLESLDSLTKLKFKTAD